MQKADPDVGIRFFMRYGTMPESSGLIGRTVLSLGKVQQLAFQQIATQRRDAVREDHAFDMVVFVLNDPTPSVRGTPRRARRSFRRDNAS